MRRANRPNARFRRLATSEGRSGPAEQAAGLLGEGSFALRAYFDIIASMKSSDAIAALGALASEARLAAFRLLVKRGPAGYTPTELTRRLAVPAPTLSFHLRELVNVGLLESRREGRNLYYRVRLERMQSLMDFLTENCCSLADEACGPNCEPLPAVESAMPPAKKRKRA